MSQTRLISCDPGVKKSHWAWFEDEFLKFSGAGPLKVSTDELVIEVPEIYKGQFSYRINNDAMAVARAAERFIQLIDYKKKTEYYPRQWKKQMKKPPHHLRVWKALTHRERQIVANYTGKSCEEIIEYIDRACTILATEGKVRRYSWQAHNTFDAIGLGLKHLKRIR